MARTRLVRRWRRNMEVRDDADYVNMLATLSEGSVRRNFNPYTDIDWDSPEFAVTENDPGGSCRRPTRWAVIPGTWRSPTSARSRSGCGGRPTWPRWDCTSNPS